MIDNNKEFKLIIKLKEYILSLEKVLVHIPNKDYYNKQDQTLYAFSNPWDVLAGSLIIKEAGGEILIIDDLTIYSSGKCLDELKKVF